MFGRHSGIMNFIVRSFFETNRKGFDLLGAPYRVDRDRAAIRSAA